VSFRFGIYRRVGDRLAELQLKILSEEILQRFPMIEVMAEPKRIYSNFIHGFSSIPVRIPVQAGRTFGSAAPALQGKMQPALAVGDVALYRRFVVSSCQLHTWKCT